MEEDLGVDDSFEQNRKKGRKKRNIQVIDSKIADAEDSRKNKNDH